VGKPEGKRPVGGPLRRWMNNTVKPVLNGNLTSAEKCSGHLRFRLRQVLPYQDGS
jgi:hypothetical protein